MFLFYFNLKHKYPQYVFVLNRNPVSDILDVSSFVNFSKRCTQNIKCPLWKLGSIKLIDDNLSFEEWNRRRNITKPEYPDKKA